MKRRTITDSRRAKMCLACGARPAVAEPGSFAIYCPACHKAHADKWNKKKESGE